MQEKEDLEIAIKALDIDTMVVENVVLKNTIVDNFNKMVPVAQAIMVTMLRQTKKV